MVPEVSEVVLISFNSFLFFPLCFIYFHHSAFHLIYPIFCLSYSEVILLVPSRVLLVSVVALFIIDWLFFISSRSLLNISCIFSILSPDYLSVTPFCFQDFGSFLLSFFWILFQVDSLSPLLWFGLVGIYHVPLLAEYFSAFSLFRLLCLGWPFCMLEVWGSSLLWRFLPVGGITWVTCQGFLVRETCIGVLVGGAGSLLSGVQWSVQ